LLRLHRRGSQKLGSSAVCTRAFFSDFFDYAFSLQRNIILDDRYSNFRTETADQEQDNAHGEMGAKNIEENVGRTKESHVHVGEFDSMRIRSRMLF
jgi:hypothetical protein